MRRKNLCLFTLEYDFWNFPLFLYFFVDRRNVWLYGYGSMGTVYLFVNRAFFFHFFAHNKKNRRTCRCVAPKVSVFHFKISIKITESMIFLFFTQTVCDKVFLMIFVVFGISQSRIDSVKRTFCVYSQICVASIRACISTAKLFVQICWFRC